MHTKIAAAAALALALLSPSPTPEREAREELARQMQVRRDFDLPYSALPGDYYVAAPAHVLRDLSPKWQNRLPEGR